MDPDALDSYSANRPTDRSARGEGMERRLVERAMHGDDAAFDALVERVGAITARRTSPSPPRSTRPSAGG